VAEKLQRKLAVLGHATSLEQMEPVDRSQVKEVKLNAMPDLLKHDAIVLGAPVDAPSPLLAMGADLDQVLSLSGKRVNCLLIQFFPFAWMGGEPCPPPDDAGLPGQGPNDLQVRGR
jgi:hypothetical protein